jgi:TPR repeat protein
MFKKLARLFGSSGSDLRKALALIDNGQRPAAFKLLARGAQKGLAEAEYQIARSYLEGAGVPGSGIEGLRWLERAAAQGFAAAQALLAAFYVQGVPTGGPDAAPGDLGATSASLFSIERFCIRNTPLDTTLTAMRTFGSG